MGYTNPLEKDKSVYQDTINKIKTDSPVGIDAQYTHAIIIDYLQQITERLEEIEKILRINVKS